ncbi:hypothetical protein [Campylobacter phage vB_CcoM-IBB_35]|uniref:Uncharacterized protein n=1 Tax=Campylobacter virus IBB35 TaxID=1006972 RepID=H6SU67_9CAUD|nr:hypothetical protein FDG52_s1gp24 [Campylobacter phage vB_CcoM-IBB_35]AEF56759.1 hypothetical protein [Campylobacter phage vB_CcoM-IBB_35]
MNYFEECLNYVYQYNEIPAKSLQNNFLMKEIK